MLSYFGISVGNYLLIEVFATQNYFFYFIALFLYLYIFNFKINILKVFIIIVVIYLSFKLFDDLLFELFLETNIIRYFIYIEEEIILILSVLHMFLLKYIPYYFDLKKLGYNLVKK